MLVATRVAIGTIWRPTPITAPEATRPRDAATGL